MVPESCDLIVVGGGIVGLATAHRLLERDPLDLVVLEAEERVAAHQTGHNSGVVHSGLYYTPGSLKARLCVEGRRVLLRFCEERGVPHEVCGKLVVAVTPDEAARLDALERRGEENGLAGLRRLRDPRAIREIEPHADGIQALLVPETGITDFTRVAEAIAAAVEERGGRILTGARVTSVATGSDGVVVDTPRGRFRARGLINCAGLRSDLVARLAGVDPGIRIVPFRGEYLRLVPAKADLVRNLIYPVPDPRFPFLGVHLTRRITGEVDVGPNARLAWKREGYARLSFSLPHALGILSWPGTWRLFRKHWKTGLGEWRRSRSSTALAHDVRRLVPELRPEDLRPGGAGVRAQAVDRAGGLVDDFRIVETDGTVHVINAPSPAATAALAIGEHVAAIARRKFRGGP